MANMHTVPCENTALGGLKTTTGAQKVAQSYLLKWYLFFPFCLKRTFYN